MTNNISKHSLTSRNITLLAHELSGVVLDVEQGDGFDSICLDTIKRVQLSLHTLADEVAQLIKERNMLFAAHSVEMTRADELANKWLLFSDLG